MAVTTWDGSSSTDWNTAANWDTGAVPTSADDVIIPDDSTTANDCTLSATGGNPKNVKSLKIEANGTIVGGGIQIRIYGESAAGFALDNDGIISGSLFLEIKSDSTVSCDFAGSSGRFNSVTVNHASCIINVESTFHIDGNLTITLGKVICGGNTVEIAGKTTIGDAGHSSEDQATLQCDASAMFLGSGRTSSFALVVNQGGTFTGGSGNHTIGSIEIKNNSNAKCTLTSAVTTLDAESASDNYNLFVAANGTFAHGSGTVTITFAGVSFFEKTSGTLALNNLILNHASANITTNSATTVAGNLTITAGTLSTSGSGNYALTVTGLCKVYGTLTGNSSTITVGALHLDGGTYSAPDSGGSTIINDESGNQAFDNDGTFTHNGGTVTITTAGNSQIDWIGTGSGNLNNLTYSGGAILEWTVNGGTIDGNLNITNGTLQSSNGNKALTVTGNVIVGDGTGSANTAILGNASEEAAQTFGSLTIDSDGKYNATSGETSIMGAAGISRAGTFTHNNGTVDFEAATTVIQSTTMTGSNAFYILKSTGQTWYRIDQDIDIERHASTGYVFWFYGNVTVTMGTDTYASGTDQFNRCINWTYVYGTTGKTYKLYAKNELYPWQYNYPQVGNSSWINGSQDARMGTAHLKGGNIIGDFTIAETTNPKSIVLDGDMEFDGVTVGNTNTLDLNGQRVEFGGLLSSSGTIECNADDGTNALVVADSVNTSSATTGNMNLIETGDGHTHTLTSSTITNWMLNGGTISNSAHGHMADNIIVGAGKFDVGHNVASGTPLVNVTTATGAELDGNTFEIPLSGDFTNSGGLIGKSGLDFDGSTATSSPFTFLDVPYDLSNLQNSDATFEMWINPESKSGDTKQSGVINGYVGGQTNRWQLDHLTNDTFNFNSHENNSSINFSVNIGKMNHIALVFDDSENLLQIYHDGKLVGQNTLGTGIDLGTVGADPDLGISWQTAAKDTIRSNYMGFKGQFYMYRIFNTARTPAQLRADMFNTHGNMTSTTGLQVMYQFDEGTGGAGDKVDNKQGTTSRDGVLANAGAAPNWVGGGTFVQGTSTLKFSKSGAQTLNFYSSDNFNNITIDAGSTTSLNGFGLGSGAPLDCFGNLIVSGTLTDSGDNSIMKLRTADKTHDFSGTLTGLYSMIVDISSGNLNIPALNTPRLRFSTSVTGTATGNLTITEELQVDSNTTFIANGKTITAKLVDLNNGTFNLGAGNLILSHTGGSNGFDTNAASVLAAGPGATISGSSAGTIFKSQNNFSVVGKIENLDVTNEELKVTGQVINCTGDIHQYFPTIDHAQQLDADTADDRDVRLGRDLDKNTELINS